MKKLIPIFLFLISIYVAKAQYVTNGNASQISTNKFLLTNDSLNQSGSIWYQNKINLNYNFSIAASLKFGVNDVNGADGIAFVLQPLSSNAGSGGGGMGYGGILPSIDVEFDTYQNLSENDPPDDHLGINVNGSTTHDGTSILGATNLPNIEDGAYHTALFTWDAANLTFTVIFDGTPYAVGNDLVTNYFSGNPFVFWGFTAATGGATNQQKVKIETVSFVEEINITALVTDINCGSTSNGAIDINVTGGTGGYQYVWTGPGAFSNTNQDISGLADGTYTVTVTDNSNVSTSATFTVNILTGTPVTCGIITNPSNNISTGQSVQLFSNASGGSGFTYSWTGNGSLSCTHCSDPSFSTNNPGTYNFNVHIINSDGCFTDCNETITVNSTQGSGKVLICHIPPGNPSNAHTISVGAGAVNAHLAHGDYLGSCNPRNHAPGNFENTNPVELQMYVLPNPSNGKFSVQLNYVSGSNAEINIFDISGSLIEKRTTVLSEEENSIDFNLDIHASGLYYIKVITEESTYIEKAFIQR